MPTYLPPKKNTELIFYIGLVSQSNRPQFQSNPTLASGDVKVSTDGGSLSNLDTLPSVAPASSKLVKVTVSATEMNGDNVAIIFSDAAGDEWDDLIVNIHTTANQNDDLPTNAEVNAEVDTALTDIGLDHLLAASVTGTDVTDDSIIAKMVDDGVTADWDGFDNRSASLEGLNDGALTTALNNQSTISTNVNSILVDTGTDIPALIAALNNIAAADVWAAATRTLTQGAASVTAAVSGSSVTVYRGTTWSISLTGLGSISAYDTIYFSVKKTVEDTDDNAYLRVKNDASGLERFNQAAPTAATNGTITVDDASAGNITITVQEAETQNGPVGGYVYDVKGVDNDGSVVMLSAGGSFVISGDVTRAIT